jgi:hypothetical protein
LRGLVARASRGGMLASVRGRFAANLQLTGRESASHVERALVTARMHSLTLSRRHGVLHLLMGRTPPNHSPGSGSRSRSYHVAMDVRCRWITVA